MRQKSGNKHLLLEFRNVFFDFAKILQVYKYRKYDL